MSAMKGGCPPVLLLIILPLAILCSYFLLSSPINIQFSFLSNCRETSEPPPDFRILIGILTMPDNYHRREILRTVYGLQRPFPRAHVDVRFVFCNLTSNEQKQFVGLEILLHDDILILNCKENMNEGKTYTYFSSLPNMFSDQDRRPPYDYVMKTDDDTYLRFDNFLESIRGKPKTDMYWGSGMPMLDQENPPFMVGPGYVLSWDLVKWIATSNITREEQIGPEDIFTGMWLGKAGKGLNRYNVGPRIYNFNGTEAEDFRPDTIAVHYLKEDFMWAATLRHFNVTGRIRPSKLYHF